MIYWCIQISFQYNTLFDSVLLTQEEYNFNWILNQQFLLIIYDFYLLFNKTADLENATDFFVFYISNFFLK